MTLWRGSATLCELGSNCDNRAMRCWEFASIQATLDRLSRDARKILDEAGFGKAVIIASNDLDEHLIASLKKRGAGIGVWGVGTQDGDGRRTACHGRSLQAGGRSRFIGRLGL